MESNLLSQKQLHFPRTTSEEVEAEADIALTLAPMTGVDATIKIDKSEVIIDYDTKAKTKDDEFSDWAKLEDVVKDNYKWFVFAITSSHALGPKLSLLGNSRMAWSSIVHKVLPCEATLSC